MDCASRPERRRIVAVARLVMSGGENVAPRLIEGVRTGRRAKTGAGHAERFEVAFADKCFPGFASDAFENCPDDDVSGVTVNKLARRTGGWLVNRRVEILEALHGDGIVSRAVVMAVVGHPSTMSKEHFKRDRSIT